MDKWRNPGLPLALFIQTGGADWFGWIKPSPHKISEHPIIYSLVGAGGGGGTADIESNNLTWQVGKKPVISHLIQFKTY